MSDGLDTVIDVINAIIPSLLNARDAWRIETVPTTGNTLVIVRTSNPGPLIGQGGSTIKALREIIRKVGTAQRISCTFDVAEGV